MQLLSRNIENKIIKFINHFYELKEHILADLRTKGFYPNAYAMYCEERVLIKKILISHECAITFIYTKEGSDSEDEGSAECFLPIK
jgi:hypothetical protein